MRTLVAVSLAGATVAAESHWVCEGRIGLNGAAGQYSRAVFHLVIGTASLDKEAWPKYVPHVAVLFTTNKHECCPYISVYSANRLWRGVCLGEVVGIKEENSAFLSQRKSREQLQQTLANKYKYFILTITAFVMVTGIHCPLSQVHIT